MDEVFKLLKYILQILLIWFLELNRICIYSTTCAQFLKAKTKKMVNQTVEYLDDFFTQIISLNSLMNKILNLYSVKRPIYQVRLIIASMSSLSLSFLVS